LQSGQGFFFFRTMGPPGAGYLENILLFLDIPGEKSKRSFGCVMA
jgi:hypothetical protein